MQFDQQAGRFDQKAYEQQIQDIRLKIQNIKYEITQKTNQKENYYIQIRQNDHIDCPIRCWCCHEELLPCDRPIPTSENQIPCLESEIKDLAKELKSCEDQILCLKGKRRMILEGIA